MMGNAMSLNKYRTPKGSLAKSRIKWCFFFVPFLFIFVPFRRIYLIYKGKGTNKPAKSQIMHDLFREKALSAKSLVGFFVNQGQVLWTKRRYEVAMAAFKSGPSK